MKVCSKCNIEYEDKCDFCTHCGGQLQTEVEKIFCPFCGKELDKSVFKYCPYCGKAITDYEQPAQSEYIEPKTLTNQTITTSQPNMPGTTGKTSILGWIGIIILILIDLFANLWFRTFFNGFLHGRMTDLSVNEWLLMEAGSLIVMTLCCFFINRLTRKAGTVIIFLTVTSIFGYMLGIIWGLIGMTFAGIIDLIYLFFSIKQYSGNYKVSNTANVMLRCCYQHTTGTFLAIYTLATVIGFLTKLP